VAISYGVTVIPDAVTNPATVWQALDRGGVKITGPIQYPLALTLT